MLFKKESSFIEKKKKRNFFIHNKYLYVCFILVWGIDFKKSNMPFLYSQKQKNPLF